MVLRLSCVVFFIGAISAGFLSFREAASQNHQPLTSAEQEDVDSADFDQMGVSEPSPDSELMLKRFVAECVEISKGSLKVPRGEADSVLPEQIVIDQPYRICRFETTQELYQLVMGVNPSRWSGPRNSVEQITYKDSVQFCSKLTQMLRKRSLIRQNQVVRLPSDAEWEYACRAQATTKFCFGDAINSKLDEYAWHSGNAAGNDPSVGQLKSNRWKLADVHGYLWEFTQTASPEPGTQTSKVRIWGGSWRASPSECGCSSIQHISPSMKAPDLGFRCVIQ